MTLSVNTFRNVAQTQSASTVIEVAGNNDDRIKTSGFFGRTFARAGANVEKNRATMDSFCTAIGREMGAGMEVQARTLLHGAREQGRPLDSRTVTTILGMMDQERGRIGEFNRSKVAAFGADPKAGLDSVIAGQLPEGRDMPAADRAEVMDGLAAYAEERAGNHSPLTAAEVNAKAVELIKNTPTGRALTAEGNAAVLNDFLAPNTGGLAKMLKEILSEGVHLRPSDLVPQETFLTEFVDKCNAENKPATGEMLGGALPYSISHGLGILTPEKMAVLDDISDNGMPPLGAEDIASLRLELIRNNELPASESRAAAEMFASMMRNLPDAENRTFETGMRGYIDVLAADKPDIISGNGVKSIKAPLVARFAFDHLEKEGVKFDADTKMYARCSRLHAFKEINNYTGEISPFLENDFYTPDDLMRVARSLGNPDRSSERQVSAGLVAASLVQLKATQPDGKPFTPDAVWNAVFGKNAPDGVTPENLGHELGKAWIGHCSATLKSARPEISEHEINENLTYVEAGISQGILPSKALATLVAANPADKVITLADFSSPRAERLDTANPDSLLEKTMNQMGVDFHRLGNSRMISPVITIAGRAIDLDPKKISNEEERNNYLGGGVDNPVIRGAVDAVADLCGDDGDSRLQRAGVFNALTQAGLFNFRIASSVTGAGIDEHSAYNMDVKRMDADTIRVTIATHPGEVADGRAVFEIDREGTGVLVEFFCRPKG